MTTQIPASPQGQISQDQGDRPKVRIGSYGGNGRAREEYHADITGLDEYELELVRGTMHGHYWVTCEGGRIRSVPTYEPLPDPIQDEMMTPFWRRPFSGVETQMSLFPFEPLSSYADPSISVQHLCGYNYSIDGYRYQSEQFQRWGFVCLRSPRSVSGEYWEIWYLPGLWAAEAELKEAIETVLVDDVLTDRQKNGKRLRAAIDFLCRHASFGSLDASFQRAAMKTD